MIDEVMAWGYKCKVFRLLKTLTRPGELSAIKEVEDYLLSDDRAALVR